MGTFGLAQCLENERDWPFCIVNILELVGESMGLQHRDDRYKRLKMMQDVDQIVAGWKRLAIWSRRCLRTSLFPSKAVRSHGKREYWEQLWVSR